MKACDQTITPEGTAVITLNRPPVNALNDQLLAELNTLVEQAQYDPEIRVLIITGSEKLFIAGADIKEINKLTDQAKAHQFLQLGHTLCNTLEQSQIPTIAAINGICYGGGLELALACHIRIADTEARFAFPEIKLGIIPGFGGTQRTQRLIGISRCIELILTGEPVTAQTAFAYGLINQVTEQGAALTQAQKLAGSIAKKGKPAVKAALSAILNGKDMSLGKALKSEIDNFLPLCNTNNMREGMQAFIEKRPPSPLDD